MPRTNLSASFATRPPVAPIAGKARIVERNTFRYETADGRTVTRLHLTDIVESLPGGRFKLDSGGYKTMTTKARMNGALSGSGFAVFSGHGLWLVAPAANAWRMTEGAESIPFYDGMILPDAFTGSGRKKAEQEARRTADLKAQIKQFVERGIKTGKPLPEPSDGDCWHCRFFDAEKPAAREASGHLIPEIKSRDAGHLMEHIREGYFHGSLIVNAMRDSGFTDAGISIIAFSTRPDHARVRRTVRRYLQKRLGLPF